jgi:hypothetical protein
MHVAKLIACRHHRSDAPRSGHRVSLEGMSGFEMRSERVLYSSVTLTITGQWSLSFNHC